MKLARRASFLVLTLAACAGAPPPKLEPAHVAALPKPSLDACQQSIASAFAGAPVAIHLLAPASDGDAPAYDAWFRALAASSPNVTYRWVALDADDARRFARDAGLQGSGVVMDLGLGRTIAPLSGPDAIERAARELTHASANDGACRGANIGRPSGTSRPGALDVPDEPLVSADVIARATSLKIEEPDRSVTLVRDGASWKLSPSGFPADDANVRAALEDLTEVKLRDRISPDASLGLDGHDAIHVVVSAGTEPLLDVSIGRQGARGTAVRVASAPEPRIASGVSAWRFHREPRNWRNRTIWHVAPEDVQRVEIKNGHRVVLTKRASGWQATLDGRPFSALSQRRVADFLGAYRGLGAEDFTADGDFGKETAAVRLVTSDGHARVLHIGNKRADRTWAARADGDPIGYAIAGYPAFFAEEAPDSLR